MENRLRQQIDEFDRSFAKDSAAHVVPTVVVTSGAADGQLLRPETLGVNVAPKVRVHEQLQRARQVTVVKVLFRFMRSLQLFTCHLQEPSVEKQLTFASALEMKPTVIEPQVIHMGQVRSDYNFMRII